MITEISFETSSRREKSVEIKPQGQRRWLALAKNYLRERNARMSEGDLTPVDGFVSHNRAQYARDNRSSEILARNETAKLFNWWQGHSQGGSLKFSELHTIKILVSPAGYAPLDNLRINPRRFFPIDESLNEKTSLLLMSRALLVWTR